MTEAHKERLALAYELGKAEAILSVANRIEDKNKREKLASMLLNPTHIALAQSLRAYRENVQSK